MDFDFMHGILDEVALEGLDGITLNSLWVRLENRPNFPIKIDDNSKAFIWRSIALHSEIEIFELPELRPVVQIYNRFEHVDDLGLVLEDPVDLIDIYPIENVSDGNVRGSCKTYQSRKNITSQVRDEDSLLLTFSEVCKRWGDKLVLVASPRARLVSLIGSVANPLIEMTAEEYCLLERIGRSRYHGEVTQGEKGLLKLNAPFSKQLHYYRKKLSNFGLVTKQKHYMRNNKGLAVCGSLLHLSRFCVQKKCKMELLIELMCDILKSRPNQMESCFKLREDLNLPPSSFKKLIHRNLEKWLKIVTVPASELQEEPVNDDSGCSSTAESSGKLVRAVKLTKHCNEDNLDDDADDNKDESDARVYYDRTHSYINLPLFLQVYRFIQNSGPEGTSLVEISRGLTLPKLDVRRMLKLLVRQNLLVSVMQEKGRQKETRYIATNFGDQNESYTTVQKGNEMVKTNQLNSSLKRKNEDCGVVLTNKHSRLDEAVLAMMDSSETDKENEPKEVIESTLSDFSSSESKAFPRIETEVCEIENYIEFSGKMPKLVNVNDPGGSAIAFKKPSNLTHRKIKRCSIILNHLKECRFTNLADLQKSIKEKEREEGYNFQVDRRSTFRLLHWLFSLKKIKIFKAVLKLGTQKTEVEFICDPSMTIDDPALQPAIEQAKFRLYSAKKDGQLYDSMIPEDEDDVSESTKPNLPPTPHELQMLQDFKMIPKFVRFKTFHKFLYYLVYGYEGNAKDTSHEPVVYHDSMTWKRFIPPLSSDHQEGWCFLADVINRLPLNIFVRTVNMRDKIHELAKYLFDEEQSNYLITHLPKKILKVLLFRRQYLFKIDEVLRYLCYMGLVSYGPQVAKTKDQMYIYVHKFAAFKDTSLSSAGYIHVNPNMDYETLSFAFDTMADVEKYWIELEEVCCATRLGRRKPVVGKTFQVMESSVKPELIEALKPKNFHEVSNVGHVPGDGLGAAGLDSSIFAHYQKNWQTRNSKETSMSTKAVSNPSAISIKALLKQNSQLVPENNRLKRLSHFRLTALRNKNNKENKAQENLSKSKSASQNTHLFRTPSSRSRRKVKTVTIKERAKRVRAPYMDEKDKAALEKMSLTRNRAEWTAQEDSFLLLCKVASSFLDPSCKGVCVPFTVIRDLLHEHCPVEGSTKTSRACQRRVKYMTLNPTTQNNVSVFLGEAKQDLQLVNEFQRPVKSTDGAAWKEVFTGLLKQLLLKFTMPASDRCKTLALPGTMELFEKHFTVLTPATNNLCMNNHTDPTNENEIKSCVLYSLIVSSMALEKNNPVWSPLLYKLYHNFPEFVLRSVVSKLRSERVLARRAKRCKRDFEPSLMATFPYRFSITYENNLLTKFPIKVLAESKQLLEKYKDAVHELRLKDDIPPGYTVAVITLAMLNEVDLSLKIPEHVIIFDSGLSKEARFSIVERMIQSLSEKESDELASILNNVRDKPSSLPAEDQSPFDEDYPSFENGSKMDETPPENEIQRSTNASRFALYLLRQELSQPPIERVQHSQDYIVLNSCEVICHLKRSDVKPEINLNQQSHPLESNAVEQRRKILTDGCLSEIKASLLAFIPAGAFNLYKNFDEPLEMIYDSYSPQTLNDAKSIFAVIFDAGSVGISEANIWRKYQSLAGELSLFEHLHLFREAMLVLRAGVASFVYVCISFAKTWALKSYALPETCNKTGARTLDVTGKKGSGCKSGHHDDEKKKSEGSFDELPQLSASDALSAVFNEEVYFLPRTWRCPDGSLNKKNFLQLLWTVMSYIIHNPSISTSQVVERFSLSMQPVQTLELIEILEKGCCIDKYFCTKPRKGGLFSPVSQVVITKNPDPDDIDHLEAMPEAVCNLSKIQDTIM